MLGCLFASRCGTGADLLPGAAGAAAPSRVPQKRQQQQQQQQQQQKQQRRKSSRSPRKAAVEYAAIVTIPPGVVPGQAMQVQLADGRCVVVQVGLSGRTHSIRVLTIAGDPSS